MLSVKDERKRAEYDVQLLANRLAYLRSEEKAAAKRVFMLLSSFLLPQ
jgi:hypothetical protein